MMGSLLKMVALQGGAIVHSTSCTEQEIEQAREVELLAIFQGHAYIYRGKLWMANVTYLLKQQKDVEQAKEQTAGDAFREENERRVSNGGYNSPT